MLGTLLGAMFMALGISLLVSDMRHPGGRLHGLWTLPLLPGIPLLVGGIGSIFGARLLTWVLMYANSIFLLWAIMAVGGNIGWYMHLTKAHPEGFFFLISLLLEVALLSHLLGAENRSVKALVIFLIVLIGIGFASIPFSPSQGPQGGLGQGPG